MKPENSVNLPNAIVAISYRDEGKGKGAFFDHFTIRQLTGWMTEIAVTQPSNVTALANLINYRAGFGAYGLSLDATLPKLSIHDAEKAAFLFIPGFTRDSDNNQSLLHQNRIKYEKELIAKAVTRGQPVLAVCAGSWTLWETFKGKIIPTSDHNYGGAMPRLSTQAAKVCNNKMIHRVKVSDHSFLAGAMGFKYQVTEQPLVNSVHWNAPDNAPLSIPSMLEITATSEKDNAVAPLSRQGNLMQPDDSTEAFETKFGAPMLGIQWHPEAFNPGEDKRQESIFQFMKTAGRTYLNRKAVNQEFQQKWATAAEKKMTFFASTTKKQTQEPAQDNVLLNARL